MSKGTWDGRSSANNNLHRREALKCVSTGKTLKASWDYISSSLFDQGPSTERANLHFIVLGLIINYNILTLSV